MKEQFAGIAERELLGAADLVIFVVDRDDNENRALSFEERIAKLPDEVRRKTVVLVGEQEVEVYAVLGRRGDVGSPWSTVRAERDSKERYFDPLIAGLSPVDRMKPGGGRRVLMADSTAGGWKSLEQLCPELRGLRRAVEEALDPDNA